MTTPAHYIKPLSKVTFPRRYIYMDSEAYRTPVDGHEVQTFRLASAYMERRSDILGQWVPRPIEHFTTTARLWEWVDRVAVSKTEKTVLWCHNLGYDMRITRALLDLPTIGWQFDALRLDDDIAWAQARRLQDGAVLTFCDFYTWTPTSLERVAQEIKMDKVPLPEDDDSEEAWFDRCDRDVQILAEGWQTVRDWMWENELGPFRTTGAAAGWAVFKYRFLDDHVLCHDDQQTRIDERNSAYAGRCEAYLPGEHHQVVEYDYAHAYVSACVDRLLPAVLTEHFTTRRWTYPKHCEVADDLDMQILVTATVTQPETYMPVLPARLTTVGMPSRICWPTGTFTGSWWRPELDAAIEAGDLVINEVHRVRYYRQAPVLHNWAEWIIDVIENHSSLLVRRVAKQWARTMVGRFGMRYPLYVNSHTSAANDLWAGWWMDGDDDGDELKRALQVGDEVFVAVELIEGRDTSPAIMSYVMMLTRLRLLDAIQTAGLHNVLYCDTDGLLVNPEGADNLRGSIAGLVPKSRYESVTVIAPKQLIVDDAPRISGLPKPLYRNQDGSYEVEQWERMRHALEEGRADQVIVRNTSMYVSGRDGRRKHLDDGTTVPVSA